MCSFEFKILTQCKTVCRCTLIPPCHVQSRIILYVRAATASSTHWTPLALCGRSRARGRWPTWTRASSTLWRSTSSAPTNASVIPSAKSGWADQFTFLWPQTGRMCSENLSIIWLRFSLSERDHGGVQRGQEPRRAAQILEVLALSAAHGQTESLRHR